MRRIKDIYLVLDTDLISQDKCIFNLVHLKQKEGWRLNGAIIAI